jgi:ABC-2 type transport system permease protein
LTLLVGASTYCFGIFIAGIIIRARKFGSLVSSIGRVGLMTLCAVNVPLTAYSDWIAVTARFLPLTNGLIAIREVLAGNLSTALGYATLELLVGLAWLLLCLTTFTRFLHHGRHNGTLDFAS